MNFSRCYQTRLLALSKAGWFALLFAFFGFAQANDFAASSDDGKSLRQSVSGVQFCINAIDADSPDAESTNATLSVVRPPLVVRELGLPIPDQHNPMVLMLRDRLMHAPPAVS